MGKKNVIWVIIFTVIVAACLISIHIITNNTVKVSAEIYVSDQLVKRIDDISSSEKQTYKVSNEYGENVICWQNGSIWIESSNCKNQICVLHGKISSAGTSIICAPHKLAVTLVS